MWNAFGKKVAVIAVLFLISCSVCIMIAPATSRGYVVPYYNVQPYNFTITKTGENSANVVVSNIFSPYLTGRNVLMEVRQISSNVEDLQSVSPLSKIIYSDGSFSSTTTIDMNTTITRSVSNLQQDQWYLWNVIPAYNAVGIAAVGSYISPISSVFIQGQNGDSYQGSYLDLRSFKVCQWDTTSGCQGGFH